MIHKCFEISGKVGDGVFVGMLIVNTQTAAQVDIFRIYAGFFQFILQLVHLLAKLSERFHVCDLAADVKMQADILYSGQLLGPTDGRQSIFPGNAKLVFVQARSDFCMGVSVYVGVNPESNARLCPKGNGQFVDNLQFRQAFHVEAVNARFESQYNLPVRFAHPGKDNA